MVECPACGADARELSEDEKVNQAGEHQPDWQARCTNDDCRAGVLLHPDAVADKPGA